VLVVDDDRAVRESLRRSLEFNGYDVTLAADGAEALAGIGTAQPDVVVMDVMMPRLDGLEATRAMRSAGHDLPILVLTARDAVGDRVEGLDAGADDYLTKPFGAEELLARIRVALRHSIRSRGQPSSVFQFGNVEVDLAKRVVRRDGKEVRLTRLEYKLLAEPVRHAGMVLTHRQLLKDVWGPNNVDQTHYLRVYMAHLRQKLEANSARPRFLLTEPGVGYRLKMG
jgi:two-component system response regulator MprA